MEKSDFTMVTGKTMCYSFQFKNLWKPDLFPMVTQSINFYYNLFSHIIEYRCLKNVIPQVDRNEWLLLSGY